MEIEDTGTATYYAMCQLGSASSFYGIVRSVTTHTGTVYPSIAIVSNTVPFTLANTDIIRFSITYQAAA